MPRTAEQFSGVLDQLDRISTNAIVARGLDGVLQFSKSSQPLIEAFSRAQTACSYPSLLLQNLANASADGDQIGNWVRASPLLRPYVPNGEGSPATSPAANAAPPAGAFQWARTGAKQYQDILSNSASLYTNPQPVTGAGGVCQPGYENRLSPTEAIGKGEQVTVGVDPKQALDSKHYRPAPPLGSPFRKDDDKKTEDQG